MYDRKKLTYKDKFVFDNQFRMDGIYIMKSKDNYFYYNYFFQNGYYYSAAALDEIGWECYQISQGIRERPWAFGCFIIEDSILKLQYYNTGYTEFGGFAVSEDWAEIINDTTIRFFKRINPKTSELNDTFYFRHCENKPDSINTLMSW